MKRSIPEMERYPMDRRSFVRTAAAMSASSIPLLADGAASIASQTAPARAGGPFVKLSCNLYSFNEPLLSGAMKLEDVIEFCAGLNFAAVDPTAYYFPGYPTIPDDSYLYAIKRKTFLSGLDISGTGVRNDFTLPDKDSRAAEVGLVKAWIECAARLGAPVLRVFSGAGVPGGYSRDEVTRWVVDCLQQCAEHGRKFGVMPVLQNHADFIRTADDIITILKRVDSEWFGLHLDIGSFRQADDPYAEIAKVARYAVTWQIKENLFVGGKEVKTDLGKIMDIVRNAGYRGYLPLETLGEGDPRVKVPKFLDEVRQAVRTLS
jgi:sugar phosphate isomerase/epimerase